MLIAGAGGFARESLELLRQTNYPNEVFFYDDINSDLLVYDRYKILKTGLELKNLFKHNPEFILGVGEVGSRLKLYQLITGLGGKPVTLISPFARLGQNNIQIDEGSVVATGSVLTCNITLGRGCLINLNCTIGHDCSIGEFSVLSPGVHVSGCCTIGRHCFIGTGAVILPGIIVGDNAVIGAGSVVNHNVPEYSTVVGVPAKPIKNR